MVCLSQLSVMKDQRPHQAPAPLTTQPYRLRESTHSPSLTAQYFLLIDFLYTLHRSLCFNTRDPPAANTITAVCTVCSDGLYQFKKKTKQTIFNNVILSFTKEENHFCACCVVLGIMMRTYNNQLYNTIIWGGNNRYVILIKVPLGSYAVISYLQSC